jgi:hypothetical protein
MDAVLRLHQARGAGELHTQKANVAEVSYGKDVTGCEFSIEQELLVVASVEGNSGIREWCDQKNAEDSVAQHGTRCR